MKIEEKKIKEFKMKLVSINHLKLGIATNIGPRILFLAHAEKPTMNVFGILPEAGAQTPEGFWHIYGGHRLWSSPEAMPRSYSLDDKPVKIETGDNQIRIIGNPEPANSIQKEITIKPLAENRVQVIHTIINIGRWPIQIACWAISVMKQNGFAIIPNKPGKVDKEGLLPDRHVSLWPYTNLADERLIFSNEYIIIKQQPDIQTPVKLGVRANPKWVAYWVDRLALIKQFVEESGEYPDFGCSVEVYTNGTMLEIETIGLLRTISPSESVHHIEQWQLVRIQELHPDEKSIKNKLEAVIKRK